MDKSRIQAQAEKLDKILNWHNEYKARHSALKKELHLCQEENQHLEFQVAQLEECKEQVDELTTQNHFLEEKVRKLCEMTINDNWSEREKRLIQQQMQENQRALQLLKRENKELKEENQQLNSQLDSAQSYFAQANRQGSAKTSAESNRLVDVWQQLDLAQQQCCQKDDQLDHASKMLQTQHARIKPLQDPLQNTKDGLRKEITLQTSKVEHLQFTAAQMEENSSPHGTSFESKCDDST